MKENRHFLVQHQGQPDQGRREADAHAELSPKQKWHQVGLRPAFADPEVGLTGSGSGANSSSCRFRMVFYTVV